MESCAFNWIRNLKFWQGVSSFKHTCSREAYWTNDHHCFQSIDSFDSNNPNFSRMDLKFWQVCGITVNQSLSELSHRKMRLEGLGIWGREWHSCIAENGWNQLKLNTVTTWMVSPKFAALHAAIVLSVVRSKETKCDPMQQILSHISFLFFGWSRQRNQFHSL